MPLPGYEEIPEDRARSYEESNNIPSNYVRIRTVIGGFVWVDEQRFPQTAAAYRSGQLTGGEPAAASGVYLRVLPNQISSPVTDNTLPQSPVQDQVNSFTGTSFADATPNRPKVNVRATFPINVKILPAQTSEQRTSWQYDFDVNIIPINVNISEPLITASFGFLNSILNNYVDEERELKTLLNYGDDKQTVALAYRYGPQDVNGVNTVQLKLLQPVPEEIQPNSSVFLSREVAKTIIDKIRVRFAPPLNTTPYLRPKNLGAVANLSLGKVLNNVTLKVLSLQTGSVSAEDLYKNKTFEDQIFRRWYSYDFNSSELNLDFTDYNNFVFYGSAAMRLAAFREKLKLIENIETNRIQFLSSSVYTAQSSSAAAIFIQDKSAQYAKEKEDIIRSFDRYEQYLYFTSGTVAPYTASAWYADGGVEFNSSSYWPKSGSVIAPVYSAISEEWYDSQSLIAQRFDEFNENNLVNTIPTHIREHDENAPYITFVSMIGHFFDTLKPYIDQYQYIYDRSLDPNTGLSKDLVNEIAEAVGFTMPTVNSIYNLADNILGTQEDQPRRDLTAEIYKRLLHNLPFFVKSKGAKTSLQTLIKALGLSNQLISVKETGIATSGSYYIFDEYSTGVYFPGLTTQSIGGGISLTSEFGGPLITELGQLITTEEDPSTLTLHSYITVPLSASLKSPKTLQMNLTINTPTFTTILNADSGWALAAVPHSTISGIGKVVLYDSSANVVMSTGYEEIFNNELFNITLRSTPAQSSIRVIKTESEDVFFDTFVTESGSFNNVWQNTGYLYIGSSGSFFGSSSFVGTLDEVRLWSDVLSDETVVNTAFDPGSNAGDTYTAAVDSLILQLSFNNINTGSLITSSLFLNEAPTSSAYLQFVSASNITTGSIARFNRTVRQLVPTVGVTSYVSNKIKLLDRPSNVTDKNGVIRLHKSKSIFRPDKKKIARGRNRIVLANSPVEIVNQNIIRNFGLENVNTALGVPTTLYKNFERSLESLRKYYNKYYYVDVDLNQYIRILSEVSSVMDQVVDYFIPSRASALKGVLIEQSILEQTRIPPIKDARLYGNNSRKTLNAVGSLTSSRPDYSATYAVSSIIEPSPETTGKYTLIQAEMDAAPVLKGSTSLISGSIDVVDNILSGSVSQLTTTIHTEETTVIASENKSYSATIDHNLFEMNKIPYNANNNGSVGAEPFDRIYPRKLLAQEIERPRHGGTQSIYLPALYDIPPIADFKDLGVYTFFNHPEGVYRFPVIKKKLSYIRPLNQQWNYGTQQFEGITTWSYGNGYKIYDVVMQQVDLHDSGSLSIETILAARAGNKLYYAFTTRPSYVPTTDGSAFYSGSVPSFLPPSLDRDNWELIRFIPVLDYEPRRVVFDTFTFPDPRDTNYKLTTVAYESAIDVPNRFVDSYNIQNISANSYTTGELIVQNIANLLAVQSEEANIRLRLYRTAFDRDTDITRPIETPPSIDSGLLVDMTIDQSNVAQVVGPVVSLISDTSPLSGVLYYTIDNLTTSQKIGFVLSLYYFAIQIQRRVPWGYLRKHYRYFRDNSTATKRRNYLGCKNTANTTIDGLPPVQVFYGEGTDLIVSSTQTNQEIITGGGGQLNVT
jgi:hypothetical protein